MLITTETRHFTVGSSAGCDLRIKHPELSRAHAKIYYAGDSVLIEDLNSKHGTFVLYHGEFKRIKSAKIKLDTIIRFGETFEPLEVSKVIKNFEQHLEKDKKDIFKRVKSVGLKRCPDCGTVLEKDKIHCECCGAIFDEGN